MKMNPTQAKQTEEVPVNKPDCKECEYEDNGYCDCFDAKIEGKTIKCSNFMPKLVNFKELADNGMIQKGRMYRFWDWFTDWFDIKWIIIGIIFLSIACIVMGFVAKWEYNNWQNYLPAITTQAEPQECSILKGIFTAYTNEERQTDSSPNINASGHRVQLGDIACPSIYSFGTKIKVFDKVYNCTDRMAERYRNSTDPLYFDIFMFDESEALSWGRQELIYEVITN